MPQQGSYPLPPEAECMCAYCLTKATHFILVNYSYGHLIPVCDTHNTEHF